MKKILLCCVLFFITEKSYGQDAANLYLTFDTGSVALFTSFEWIPPFMDSSYFTDSSLMTIDTNNFHHNQWEIGRPQKTVFNSAYSYPNAIVTDTLHSCLPNDTSVFILAAPYAIGLGGEFSFEYRLDIDSGDIATVEVSDDLGVHWLNFLTDTDAIFWSFESAIPSFSTSTTGWERFAVNLNQFGGYPYLFRFTLITDSDTSPRDGWIMDNFYLGYLGEGVPILNKNNLVSLYPNPATTDLTIKSADNITDIIVTNVLGQVVYRQDCNNQLAVINVAGWQKGMYFVKINDGEVWKFLKE